MKVQEILAAVKTKAACHALTLSATGAAVAVGSAATAFASSEGSGGTSSLPTVAITTDMLTPLVEGVVSNIGVILLVGLGLFAIMLGIRIIPGLITRFIRA